MDGNIHLKVQGMLTVACYRAVLPLGHWAGFPPKCFLAARTQLHSLGDIPTDCHALPSESLSQAWSAFAFFPLFYSYWYPVSYLQPHRHIWPFHSLTALIIWLFCCSALLLFIFVNIFCIMRCSGVKIMSCMYSHESSIRRTLIPSLLQATLQTQKRGWRKVQWWLKSLFLGI